MTNEDTVRYANGDKCHVCVKKCDALNFIQHAHRPGDDRKRFLVIVELMPSSKKMTFTDSFVEHRHKKGATRKERTVVKSVSTMLESECGTIRISTAFL